LLSEWLQLVTQVYLVAVCEQTEKTGTQLVIFAFKKTAGCCWAAHRGTICSHQYGDSRGHACSLCPPPSEQRDRTDRALEEPKRTSRTTAREEQLPWAETRSDNQPKLVWHGAP
jgi:hypothetical protein